jgi:protease I
LPKAGAEWVDREVVVDRNLISSRKVDDIPAFNHEIVDVLRSGIERERRTA